MNRMMYGALAVFLIFSGLIGCGKKDNTDRVKDTVLRYNRLLAESCAKMDISPVKEVITENHESVLEHRLEGLRTSGRSMESELREIEFLELRPLRKNIMMVKTREVWDVRHRDIKNGGTVNEIKGLAYVMSYTLAGREGKWLIDSADVIEEKGYKP